MALHAKHAADHLGVSISTLRYYEEQGLIPPVQKDEAGYRLYGEEDLEWLKMILCFRNMGMPIREIKEYTELAYQGSSTIPERKNIMYHRRDKIEEQMEALKKALHFIELRLAYYNQYCEQKQSEEENPKHLNYIEEWRDFQRMCENLESTK